MIYQNNFALAGTTALMYNIEIKDFFDADGEKKSSYSGLTDIGFRYKKTAASDWNTMSIVSPGTILTYINVIESRTIDNNHIVQRYDIQNGHIYPCRALIKGLDANTSYILQSYFTDGSGTHYYNEQTISTLPDTANITYDDITVSDSVPSDKVEEGLSKVSACLTSVVEIFQMFCPVEWHFSPSIYYADDGIAADSSMSFNIRNIDSDPRSITVHEAAHNWLRDNRTDIDEDIVKFMEFATSVENASWKKVSGHNYPIISSARYSYMDDCLVAAACWLSRRN